MKRVLLKIVLVVLVCAHVAYAQDRTIKGKVTSADDGGAMPGVNVVLKGSTIGTVTDNEGNYSLELPAGAGSLVFSFIGFAPKEVAVGQQSIINTTLTPDLQELDEVVVTAQGLERDTRSIGYSFQTLSGATVSQRSEPNILNTLRGKIAGVNIVTSSGTPGSSTNINIRGITSFSGSNQPLIVIDGVIVSNDVNNSINTLFGTQPSNRLNDINPDIIESVTVLKGPAASVLYGSRASAGAILLTTKSGKGLEKKTEISVSSSLNFQNVAGLPELQNSYGQGTNNEYVPTSTNSWGPAFGGSLTQVVNLQGETVPYQAYPNNVNDFYRTGRILQNTVTLATGNSEKNFLLSLGSTNQVGIVPNSSFDRYNVNANGSTQFQNKLRVATSINYARSSQTGSPQGNGGSFQGQLSRIPRSFDLAGRPYKDALGRSIYYSSTQNHPFWFTEFERSNSLVDRVFGNFKIDYNIKEWLNIGYRVSGDTYFDRRKIKQEIGSPRVPAGRIFIDNFYRAELNGDLLITAAKDNIFTDGFSVSALVGHNLNQRVTDNSFVQSGSLTVRGFDNPNNGSVFTGSGQIETKRRLMGYYGQLSLAYKNYAFLELNGRADQSSTLPKQSNTYFYPGVSVSLVPSDAFKFSSNTLSYLKLRASIAKVGRDAEPYAITSTYSSAVIGNNTASVTFPISVGSASVPGFRPGAIIGSSTLTPEFVTSQEVGLNLGLFQNRVSLEGAYFFTKSENQIFDVAISTSSGYSNRTTNVGLMENKGLEFVLNGTIIQAGGFEWETSINYTRLRNIVREIAPGVESSPIAGNVFGGIFPTIKVGEPYGVFLISQIPRTETGEKIVNPATGGWAPSISGVAIGNPQPDWLAGMTNTFSYKGLSLSILIDTRQGGDVLSFATSDVVALGHAKITEADRDQPRILDGVIPVTGTDGTITYVPNNIQITSQGYWGQLSGLGAESNVFDATVYRLREASLSYRLPKSLISKTPFGDVSIGVSGSNLWFFAPYAPIDPEVNTQGAGNIQGFELSGAPNTRNYGFNLRFTL